MSAQDALFQLPRYLSELSEWLCIPSISADPAYKDHVRQAAQWLADHMTQLGGYDIALHDTPGHPIVVGRFGQDPSKPTILVYGHYDVQPPDPLDLWETPPFEPTVRHDKIYARGASDDKGQVFLHLKAIELLQKQDDLPCNIIFLIEGEEECGSVNLANFLQHHSKNLPCDAILISDTWILATETPSLTAGMRGISYIEVTLTGPKRDLHSGGFGGAVANPIHALSNMIIQLHDEDRRITIPGFYDDVREFSKEERRAINAVPFDESTYKKDLKVQELQGETGYSTLERVGIRPCLDVNGIWGGYTGEGAKTVLPSQAHAKISMRLVANQNHEQATAQLIDYLYQLTPPTMTLNAKNLHGGPGALTNTSSAAYKAAQTAFEIGWGKKPLSTFDGGSIPIIAQLHSNLNAEVVLMGFGLSSDALHSPNEHFVIEHIPKGIATIMAFHHAFAKRMAK